MKKTFLFLISIFFFFSCSTPPEKRIVGMWVNFEENEGYTFTENETVTYVKDEKSVSGQWEFIEDADFGEVLMLSFYGDLAVILLKVDFRGDVLILTDLGDESVRRFRRL